MWNRKAFLTRYMKNTNNQEPIWTYLIIIIGIILLPSKNKLL